MITEAEEVIQRLQSWEGIADRAFEVQIKGFRSDEEICKLLDHVFGHDWEDWTADHYDRSIEVYRVTELPEDLSALRAAGFARAWVHSGAHKGGGRRCDVDNFNCRCPCIPLGRKP